MKHNKNNTSSGLSISGVLTLIFIVLKLIGTIDWSWWWVLSPSWISLILWIILLVVITIAWGCDKL